MNELIALIDSLHPRSDTPNGKHPLAHVGLISCSNTVLIRHVPFYDPCIIVVLSGRKVLFEKNGSIVCDAGSTITVPAPSSFDLRNEPDPQCHRYRALVVPFRPAHLERLRKAHDMEPMGRIDTIGALTFGPDELLLASLMHYLQSPNEPRILDHRLMEILLVLVGKDKRLLSYLLNQESWSNKVRAVLAADLAREWELADVCATLATSESTLRRQLQREATGFRELLHELRLCTALTRVLQTSSPVYQVAYDCGYQSVSRFTNNFRERFGLTPRELRASVDGSEQEMTVSGHSGLS